MKQEQILKDKVTVRMLPEGEEIPSSIPGSVYDSFLKAGKMEDPYWKDNEYKAFDLMRNDFMFSCRFDAADGLLLKDQVFLRFDGVDTVAKAKLNGKLLGKMENMHRIYEYPVKELLKERDNLLTVEITSPVEWCLDAYDTDPIEGTEHAIPGFPRLRKSHCMFGWDWGPRIPDAGIWRPVTLTGVDRARITDLHILQHHQGGKVSLEIKIQAEEEKEYSEGIRTLRCRVTGPEGECVGVGEAKTEYSRQEEVWKARVTIPVEDPKLWWPNGLGDQPLYMVEAQLFEGEELLDEASRRIGLRTMTVERKKDQWGESFAHCVNGVTFFAMGADYIPEDNIFPRINKERSRRLLTECVRANFNTIRVWGGGYYPDDWFYDLCDEMGIVIWQDFMFCCAVYDLSQEFEENITKELIDNIRRLRHHASLGLWCGNNEMEMFVKEGNWVTKPSETADYIKMYEYIFPKLVKKYDPQTFYWPASPSSGGSFDEPNDPNRGDVHYWTVWHGGVPFTEYRKYYFRYLSEFGFQSFPAKKTIEAFTDDEKDWNIFSYIMEKHQRNDAANGKIMNYMSQTYLYPSSFDLVLYASQLLQADAIRYGVEHFRRNRGRCMGAVYWQLNDIWPVASWASVDYFGRLKALQYAARRFFAPVLLSCQEEGLLTQGLNVNEFRRKPVEKSVRFNVSNETRSERHLKVVWSLRNALSEIKEEHKEELTVGPLSAVWMDKVELPQADLSHDYVRYDLYEGDCWISGGSLIFSVPKHFCFEDPRLSLEVNGDEITVSSDAYAKYVEILNENEDLILSDNYFDMDKGKRTVKIISGKPEHLRVRSVYDIR